MELRYAVAPITHVQVRDASESYDSTWTMEGYAAVFNQDTTLYDSKFLQLTESIDPAAFNTVLRDQPLGESTGVVHFNFGHDMATAVAATDVPAGQPGSLDLRADKNGLFFTARVPKDDPDGVRLAAKMRSGVIKQASFAFTVSDAKYEYTEASEGPDTEHRTILEIGHLYDVCACAQGAYSQTVSGLRSYAAALGHSQGQAGPTTPFDPAREAGATVRPDEGSGAVTSEQARIAAMQAVRGWRKRK